MATASAAYCRGMARKPRDQRPGYHHAVSRGNNKQRIFLSDADRVAFLALLDLVAARHGWHILAYCLMRNHYHLVIRTESANLSQGMWELNLVYARYFNAEHDRIDHLFGKRYWSEFLDDRHLRNAIRYVIQNPRRAGARGPLEAHAWTSYRPSIGYEFALRRFARDELLGLFGHSPRQAVAAFMTFCEQPAPPREREAARYQVAIRKRRIALT